MRSTVVPAQVTTVEDRVAGSLTFPQLTLLIAGLALGSLLFLVVPPRHHLAAPKLALAASQMAAFAALALRVRGRTVAEWLVLILRFRFRPRVYVFTKNDLAGRELILPEARRAARAKAPVRKPAERRRPLSLPEKERVEQLLANPALSVSFALSKKGGVDVSLQSRE